MTIGNFVTARFETHQAVSYVNEYKRRVVGKRFLRFRKYS